MQADFASASGAVADQFYLIPEGKEQLARQTLGDTSQSRGTPAPEKTK
jgi:hypothetical protein